MKKRAKREVHKKLERTKKIKITLLVVLLIAFIGLFMSLMRFEGGITGFVVLPAGIEGKEEVINYVKTTHHFNEFSDLIKDKPVLEKIVLCKNKDVCKVLEIKQKIEDNNWEDTYYWYVRFSGTQVVKTKNLGFVILETTKKIYLEFIVRGSDGEIMQVHIGETAWEV